MSEKTNTLHTAILKNNCPTCFSTDGLELVFTQNEKENAFCYKPNSKIDESLYCKNCKNVIYPVNWTTDIELVYNYNKKIAETKRLYLKVKPLFYILIISAVAVMAAVTYALISSL